MARYFTLKEMLASSTGLALKIDNTPNFDEVEHLSELVAKILDPLRVAWGKPIVVTSGYRCPRLNTAVGGVATSAHLRGYAADLQPKSGNIGDFINFARDWAERNKIKFDQMIDERDKKGNRWLHIGLYGQYGQQRGQFVNIIKK